MKLTGHAKLILRDGKTGKVVYQEEHHNTITPALAKIFTDNISGTLDYSKITPLFSKLLGGVCLFSGTMDSTKVFLPKAEDAILIAHAGQNSYGSGGIGADTKRGIPNNSPGQSGPITNGFRWVWDWGTTQGNGTITDLALTHADTGDYWNEEVGNNTMDEDFEPVESVDVGILSTSDFVLDGTIPAIVGAERIPIGFYGDLNTIVSVAVDATNQRLNVYISKFTGTGVWLWNELGEPYEEQTIAFPISHAQWGTWEHLGRFCYAIAYDQAAGKIYAITVGETGGSGSYQDNGQILYVDTLNLSTSTTTSSTIDLSGTLGTLTVMLSTWSAEGALLNLAVVDGNIFLPTFDPTVYPFTNSGKSIRVNLNDTTDVEMIDGLTDDFVWGGAGYSTNGQIDLGNDRIMYPNSFAAQKANGDYQGYSIVRASMFPIGNEKRFYTAKQPVGSPIQFLTCDSNGAVRGCILNKLYQATVFHLETPVTKTASLTMSVEYTLTQESEVES